MKLQQKRIELIANNLSVAIQTQVTPHGVTISASGRTTVYDSVIHNFASALTTMDSLVVGKPQRILDGGVLLGLTSWHLYPDFMLLGPETKEVFQKDELIAPSGIATLSLAYQESPPGNQEGVYWSLPLSSLRYYGTVQCSRSSLHDSRLSFPKLQALILGASLDSLDTLPPVVEILKALWDYTIGYYQRTLQEFQQAPVPFKWNRIPEKWIDPAMVSTLLQSDTDNVSPLYRSGEPQFIDIVESLHILYPLMGGIDLLESDSPDDRKVAMQLIRYGANSAAGWVGNPKETSHSPCFGVTDLSFILQNTTSTVDKVGVLRGICQSSSCESGVYKIRFRRDDGTWAFASLSTDLPTGSKRSRGHYESEESPESEEWLFLDSRADHPGFYGAETSHVEEPDSQDSIFPDFLQTEPKSKTTLIWDYVIGMHNLAAVYIRRGWTSKAVLRPVVPLSVVQALVQNSALDLKRTMQQVQFFLKHNRPNYHFSLRALGRIADHYKREMPHITLSMGITKHPPWTWSWSSGLVQELDAQHIAAASLARSGIPSQSIYPSPLTRQQAFASILQFESGTLSVETHEMDQVMAISSGNSLFVAQKLLHDPIPPPDIASCAVAHVVGNVGKPGIALLFAPQQPEVREHDVDKWHVINHAPYDGTSCGGSFKGASLHMSFTGWEGPLRVRGPSAFRGMEAYHLETQISMLDQGEWIADLNIIKSLDPSPNLRVCAVHKRECNHNPSIAASGADLVSVDC